jgi:hypothetical protein
MLTYKENFPVGSKVRIAEMGELKKFQETWQYHHKLESIQLAYAGRPTEVRAVSFYHGGDVLDVLYELWGIPAIWHEQCLHAAQVK